MLDHGILRLALACGLFSTWLVSLAGGVVLGGAIHLVLLAATLLVPWRTIVAEHRADLADRPAEHEREGPTGDAKDRTK